MNRIVSSLCLGLAIIASLGVHATYGRSLMPHAIVYVDGTTSAVGECKFWAMYLGNHDLVLTRKFPGDDPKPVKVGMNLSLVSSGYIEGSGASSKGKISAQANLAMTTGSDTTLISLDSIDFIYDWGTKVKLRNGLKGDLVIDVEGVRVMAKGLELRVYQMIKQYGEEVLKDLKTVRISGFAFNKDGAKQVISENAAATPAPEVK